MKFQAGDSLNSSSFMRVFTVPTCLRQIHNCGLLIDPDHYFMGASLDGKIIEFTLEGIKKFFLSGIKMSTQDMSHYCRINSTSYCQKMLNLR